jgi:hypothetical protein
MTLEYQIKQQRVKHIISSYQLDGDEMELCEIALNDLLSCYAMVLIELALVETIAQNWATIPMPQGRRFLQQVQQLLQDWESNGVWISYTPDQFQQITGLDPQPVFENSGLQPLAQR